MTTSKVNLSNFSESEIYWACRAADASDLIHNFEAQIREAGPDGFKVMSKLMPEVRNAEKELEQASEKCASIWDRMELDVFAIRAARNEWCAKLAEIFQPAFAVT